MNNDDKNLEFILVCECINAIQGIEGKYIKWCKSHIYVKNQTDEEEFYSTEEDDEEEENKMEEEIEEENKKKEKENEEYHQSVKLHEIERMSFQLKNKTINQTSTTVSQLTK